MTIQRILTSFKFSKVDASNGVEFSNLFLHEVGSEDVRNDNKSFSSNLKSSTSLN